ncbi:MAG: FG-GAP-like repeat-containing protein, partial [Bacteroidota bacterium]
KSKAWGLDLNSFSNGASYADLDNDGDLDYIINNINDKVSIFENRANNLGANYYLQVTLEANESNAHGLGAKIYLTANGMTQYKEVMNTRGYLGSVPSSVHFGLGTQKKVDELKVIWPSGKVQIINNLTADQRIILKEVDAKSSNTKNNKQEQLFADATNRLDAPFRHKENDYDDFEKEVLLPHKMSNFGPALASGDLNGNQLDDLYVGGASGQAGAIYIQQTDGTFKKDTQNEGLLTFNSKYEDVTAEILDINGDGKNDLYIVSGGNEHSAGSNQYQDRLYVNTSNGMKSIRLPAMPHPGSCVKPFDFDEDGDIDLFVGGRQKAQQYPFSGQSYLLENKGNQDGMPVLEDVTEQLAKGLSNIGMVTDALWSDYDGDGDQDLMIVGEWMPLTIFENEDGSFSKVSNEELEAEKGWWFCIEEGDFDQDGDMDYLLGNLGLNYKYKASQDQPFSVYAGDMDKNGASDIVLGYYNDDQQFPVRGLQCSSEQMPSIKKKFASYESFAISPIEEVYGDKVLESALHYTATNFASCYLENKGNGELVFRTLPFEAQFSSVNDIIVQDFDQDGNLDALLGGNLHASEVETTRHDASIGVLLKGSGTGDFEVVPYTKSGINLRKDVKKLVTIKTQEGLLIAVGNN